MNQAFFGNKYLILVLAFVSPMIINIGGEVSPGFLFMVATFPFWKRCIDIKRDQVLKRFVKLFYVIIVVQLIWIPFAETDVFIQIKGLLVTISGLIYFLYYYMVYSYNQSVVKWYALGVFVASFVFVNVLAETAGGDYGFWKFQVMPRIVSSAILVYLWTCNNKVMRRFAPILLVGVGMLGLATGARSSGLTPFIAGVLALTIQRGKTELKNIKKYVLTGTVGLYAAYAVLYVPNVLNGNITSGNSEQLKVVDNPYNPINLLVIGRTDSMVPFIAFLDNPITGWGYNTTDPGFKYHLLINKLKVDSGEGYSQDSSIKYNIPGHSIWGYYACSYGIVVFVALCMILYNVWKIVFRSLVVRDKYLLYRIFALFGITWNFLFSPMPHFKTLPASIALVVVFSVSALKMKNYEK